MTIPQRNVTITGVFAENAATTIPAVPVSGTSYRDTEMTTSEVQSGWPFKTVVDSAQFNQAMFQYSSITALQEKYGFLPWSNLTNYEQGSFCLGTNGVLYQAKQATGPSSTAFNPVNDTSHTYWKDYIKSLLVLATPVGSIFPFAGVSAPEGFLLCDGSAVSRTTYAELFAVIGTTYGSGNGTTTFNLPNSKNIVTSVNTSVPIKGNGKTFALTDGTHTGTFRRGSATLALESGNVGTSVGSTISAGTTFTANKAIGVTTDASKSGIVGTITRSVFSCKFIIKY